MLNSKDNTREHLPLYGIGPIYVGIIFVITIIFVILSYK